MALSFRTPAERDAWAYEQNVAGRKRRDIALDLTVSEARVSQLISRHTRREKKRVGQYLPEQVWTPERQWAEMETEYA